jgi:cyclase
MSDARSKPSRREALERAGRAGLGAVSAWALEGAFFRAAAQTSQLRDPKYPQIPSWKTELHQLAPEVYAYTQATGPGVDNASLSNAGVIAGEHLLAIDALGPPVHAKAFIATATRATGKKFGRVVNTHHHRDHTNGNCFFLPAEIVAHEYCRQAVIEQGIPAHPYDNRPDWQQGMNELKLAPPTTTFSERLSYRYGDTEVELIYNGPAHTWGDVMVHLPRHKILFAADIAFFYVTPAGHNGHITKWIDAIDRVMKMDVTMIVPGHGPVGTKKELSETREYLDLLVREVGQRHRMGMRPGEAAADLPLGRFANWTNPERHVWNTVRLYAEFNGTLTPEMDVAATDAAMKEYNAIQARKRSAL